jgi:hypothetical protein
MGTGTVSSRGDRPPGHGLELVGRTKEPRPAVDDHRTMYELDTIDTDEPDAHSPEEQRILSWRYEQLLELGLTQAAAQLLAESGSDLGLVRRLVAAGCAPDLAARIAL